MSLSDSQKRRYDRTIKIPEIGYEGQQRLSHSRVLVIGAGGLGSPVILYLAAAGVGTIGVADYDVVDLTNLQRQIIHSTSDVDSPKTASAARKVALLNPHTSVEQHGLRLDETCMEKIVSAYDFIIDATDSFESKFLINDVCVKAGKPFSHAGVVSLGGQTMTVVPGKSACYRCVFKAPPPKNAVNNSAQIGILGAVAGTIGTIQATECIKCLVGFGALLTDTLLTYDCKQIQFRCVPVKRNDSCEACSLIP